MQEFLTNAGICASQVAVMFVFIAIGFVLFRKRTITDAGVSEMTTLLLRVVNTCMIANSFIQTEYSPELSTDLIRALVVSVLAHGIGIAISMPVFAKAPDGKKSVLRYATIFSNCGFMSLPLTDAVFGARGTVYVSVYVAIFNLLVWTFGIRLYGKKLNIRKALVNPGTIGLSVGLLFYFLPNLISGFETPSIVKSCFSMAAAVNTPLAMILLGTFLSKCDFRPQKGEGWTVLCAVLRLIIIPVVTFGILRLILPSSFVGVVTVMMIPIAASSATNTVLFASDCGQDAVYGSKLVSISTIICIVTIPLISAAAMALA